MTLIVLSVAVLLHVQVMRFRFERPTQWLHSEATVHQAFLLLPKQQMWNADQKKKKTFCQLCISIVWPHMEYGAPVWDPCTLQKRT